MDLYCCSCQVCKPTPWMAPDLSPRKPVEFQHSLFNYHKKVNKALRHKGVCCCLSC